MNPVRKVELPVDITGQLYLHSMPGRYEPLRDVWAEISRLGVSSIICLTPLDEIREKSPKYAQAIEDGSLPCAIRRLPVCDYQGPDDDEAFRTCAVAVAAALRGGETVLVHCGAGHGRTGMFAIAAVMALGLTMDDARKRVAEAESAPERSSQESALQRLGNRLSKRE